MGSYKMSIREETLIEYSEKVTHAENKGVATRLLARLLKAHGDNPPDEASRRACESIRLRMFAGTYRRLSDQAAWAKQFREQSMDVIAEETSASPDQTMRTIVSEVAEKHNIPVRYLFHDRRAKPIVHARQEAMWRCAEETGYSYPRIGAFFGRDHTTVIYSVKTHAARMAGKVAA